MLLLFLIFLTLSLLHGQSSLRMLIESAIFLGYFFFFLVDINIYSMLQVCVSMLKMRRKGIEIDVLFLLN